MQYVRFGGPFGRSPDLVGVCFFACSFECSRTAVVVPDLSHPGRPTLADSLAAKFGDGCYNSLHAQGHPQFRFRAECTRCNRTYGVPAERNISPKKEACGQGHGHRKGLQRVDSDLRPHVLLPFYNESGPREAQARGVRRNVYLLRPFPIHMP